MLKIFCTRFRIYDVHSNLIGRLLEAHGHSQDLIHRDAVPEEINGFLRMVSNIDADHCTDRVLRPKLLAVAHNIDTDGLFQQSCKVPMHQQSKGRADLQPHGCLAWSGEWIHGPLRPMPSNRAARSGGEDHLHFAAISPCPAQQIIRLPLTATVFGANALLQIRGHREHHLQLGVLCSTNIPLSDFEGASVQSSHKGRRHSLSLLSAADIDLAWPRLSQLDLVQWLTNPIYISHTPIISLFLHDPEPGRQDGDVAFHCLQPSMQGVCALNRLLSRPDRSISILARLLLERRLPFGTLLCLVGAPALLR